MGLLITQTLTLLVITSAKFYRKNSKNSLKLMWDVLATYEKYSNHFKARGSTHVRKVAAPRYLRKAFVKKDLGEKVDRAFSYEVSIHIKLTECINFGLIENKINFH